MNDQTLYHIDTNERENKLLYTKLTPFEHSELPLNKKNLYI